jgi:adenylyltransferase/sulfurtransferase
VPSCAEGGVLGILPGMIGVIQATETVKLILDRGDPLLGRLLLYNALDMQFREMRLQKDPDCPVCGEHPTVTELIDYQQFCGLGQAPSSEAELTRDLVVSPIELQRELAGPNGVALLDVREPHEADICRLDRARLIPLGELENRMQELNPDQNLVVYCRSGVRSAKAVNILREAGFPRVRNLAGGILAWADEVQPELPRY